MHWLTTKIILFITIFLLLSSTLSAQQDSIPEYQIKLRSNMGIFWRHRYSMDYLINSRIEGFNLEFQTQTTGKRLYEKVYRYPRVGLGYYFAAVDNVYFGTVHGLYSFINIPIVSGGKISLNYTIAPGITYVSKVFDRNENPFNIVIGNHINNYFNLGFDVRYLIGKHVALTAEAGLIHYSNGGTIKPNLGINVVNLSTGITWSIPEITYRPVDHNLPLPDKKFDYQLTISGGCRQISEPIKSNYLVMSIMADAGRIISHKRRFGIGLDLIYDESLITLLRQDGYQEIKRTYLFRPGVHISHDLRIHKFDILMQAGTYLYSERPTELIYSRFGLRYNVTCNSFVHVSLVTHFAVAQFIEWGIGYRF